MWNDAKRSQEHARGFTLVEVLVAAVILFTVLGTAMLAYQTSMHSSERAASLINMLKVAEVSQQHIRKAIRDAVAEGRQDDLDGQTRLFGVDINWRASRIRSESPPEQFDPDMLDDVLYADRYHQYRVWLTLTFGTTERTYEYLEFAWESGLRER